jgi:hypothetical protein
MKDRWSLLPFTAIREAVAVLTLGASKHDKDGKVGWTEKTPDEYFDKVCRHLVEWRTGQLLDPETGRSHLAHALADLAILLAMVLRG